MKTRRLIPDSALDWSHDDPRVQKWGAWDSLTDAERANVRGRILLTMFREAAECCAGLPLAEHAGADSITKSNSI